MLESLVSLKTLMQTQALASSGTTVSDALAIAAFVLAFVTIGLDIVFFWMTTNAVNRAEREQSQVFTEMREVLAQISVRAQVVQEQVDRETGRLIEVIATRFSSNTEAAVDQFSDDIVKKLDRVEDVVLRLSSTNASNESVAELKADFDGLRSTVASLPNQLGTAALDTVRDVTVPDTGRISSLRPRPLPRAAQVALYSEMLALYRKQGTFKVSELIEALAGLEVGGRISVTKVLMQLSALESKGWLHWEHEGSGGLVLLTPEGAESLERTKLH